MFKVGDKIIQVKYDWGLKNGKHRIFEVVNVYQHFKNVYYDCVDNNGFNVFYINSNSFDSALKYIRNDKIDSILLNI